MSKWRHAEGLRMTFDLSPERINFIKVSLRHPLQFSMFCLRGIDYLFAALYRKTARYIKKRNLLNKPMPFSITDKTTPSEQMEHDYKLVLNRLPGMFFSAQPYRDYNNIKLASETIEVANSINWSCRFRDQEDSFALNRFGWLLDAMLNNPSAVLAERALHWMQDWIDVMGSNKTNLAWESYSVAERLSNWPFLLRIIECLIPIPETVITKFEKTLICHINYLLDHLELSGTSINNHILNDARGLYIGAVAIGDLTACNKAKKIFYEWTEKLIGPDGMLNEHSSHYQFLICQRYEQVLFVASHLEDSDFCKFIDVWVERMRQARDFWGVRTSDGQWNYPLIGDISPDFTPQWLSSNPTGGWSTLKKWLDIPCSVPSDRDNKRLIVFDDSFIRYDTGVVTIFWHIETENSTLSNNHSHYDLGSFVLFYKGKQVFTDNGLRSYLKTDSFGKSALAHSTITIDGLGAYCQDRWINQLKGYRQQQAQFRKSQSDNQLEITIKTNGFARLTTPTTWERTFIVNDNDLTIVDNIKSIKGKHIKASFQLAPQIEGIARDNEIAILFDHNQIMSLKVNNFDQSQFSVIKGNTDTQQGWHSKEYGTRLSGTTVAHQYLSDGTKTTKYEIRWQNE